MGNCLTILKDILTLPPLPPIMNELFAFKKYITKQISSIPKKNKVKFQADLLKLIEFAHKDDYENYEIE